MVAFYLKLCIPFHCCIFVSYEPACVRFAVLKAKNLLDFCVLVVDSVCFCSSIWLQVEEVCCNRALIGVIECTLHLNH